MPIRARLPLLALLAFAFAAIGAAPAGAAGWSTGVALTSQLGAESAVWSSIGVAPGGAALAAWQDELPGDQIHFASRPAGGSFGSGTSFGAGTGDADFAKTAAAVTDSGAAVVAWLGKDPGGQGVVEAAYRPAGGSFSAPEVLAPVGLGAGRPDVAISAAGKAVVVWAGGASTWLAEAATHGPSTDSFAAAEVLNDGTDLGMIASFEPRLAIDGSGNAVVVFPTLRAGGMGTVESLQWARMTAGSSQFGDAADLGAEGATPDIAVDGSGRATVVWQKEGAVRAAVQATAGGSFGSPLAVSDVADGAAGEPRLGVSSAGAPTVVFKVGPPGSQKVMWTGAIGAFADPQDLSSPGNSGDAHIALDAAGDAAAVWTRFDGSRETVEGSYRPAGGIFAPPTTLTKANTSGNLADLGIDSAGNATAIWQTTAGFGVVWTSTWSTGTTPPPGEEGGGGDNGGGGQQGGGQGGGSGAGGSGATAPPVTSPAAKKPAVKPLKCPKGKKKKKVKGKAKCVKAGKPGKKKR